MDVIFADASTGGDDDGDVEALVRLVDGWTDGVEGGRREAW